MLIIQKYGGTSVGSIERIKGVAQRVAATHDAGHQVAVVVSAMSGETNRLLGLAKQISSQPDERECDVLVSTGEQVSVALLAMVLKDMGYPAFSLLGHQVQISTDSSFGKARIKQIDAERLISGLKQGKIAVVAGFQGVDADDNITTLGRGRFRYDGRRNRRRHSRGCL
jgi:aspartate kinase